ncbi:scaffold protein [Salinisphaera shabanensis T35B1]|uniref:iron-sulfur cluster assembly scaffold protein n=1 Tax=Salinisphaera shabanensis TaxID=180542 RepID=UPI00334058FF
MTHMSPVWQRRFLAPGHALADYAIMQWQVQGGADTPGADARCRLYLAVDGDTHEARIDKAAFAMFGPPVAIASADWACEWLQGRTIEAARSLSSRDFEQALCLAPAERYAALLVLDALADALARWPH